jgi:hypothetical protein
MSNISYIETISKADCGYVCRCVDWRDPRQVRAWSSYHQRGPIPGYTVGTSGLEVLTLDAGWVIQGHAGDSNPGRAQKIERQCSTGPEVIRTLEKIGVSLGESELAHRLACKIAELLNIEPPADWEVRALELARREGLL